MKAFFRRLVRPILELQVKRFIRRSHITVVAVTGSVGKTTTRTAIATVLAQKYKVLTHPSNYNDTVSVPLAVFDLNTPSSIINVFAWIERIVTMEARIWRGTGYNLVVLELGTDQPGEIAHFMKYLAPEVGVVTAVTPEHMEFFSSLDAVAEEELSVTHGSKHIVLSHDDIAPEYRRKFVPRNAEVTTFGLDKGSNYHGHVVSTDPVNGTRLKVLLEQGSDYDVDLKLYGEPALKAALAATAVAELLGLEHHQIKAGLAQVKSVNGRLVVLAGLNGSTLLDDTYNSSPDAVTAALQALLATPATGRRIAVLGSMNELGKDSQRYHEAAGRAVVAVADVLVTVGDMANRYLGPAAVASGFDDRNYKPAASPFAAGEFLKLMVGPGDIVLVKGSQNGVFTEETVKLLLADPADCQRLVRQTPGWMAEKQRQFPS